MSAEIDSAAADRLLADAERLGVALTPVAAQRIEAYLALLAKWNQAYNLTAVRDLADMRVRHALDALAVLPWVPPQTVLADVGSGPGIPGVILALARPDLCVTLMDSNLKMTRFAEAAVRELGIERVTVQRARVESLPPAAFDQIISRAFAATADFLRLTAHLARPGGQWLAMKGRLDPAEQQAIPAAFHCVGTHALPVPGLLAERHLLIYEHGVPA